MSEWPAMLEVKGRVRLSGFGKFIQELPKSRSRTLMVYKAFFCYHCSSSIHNLLLQTTIEVTLLLVVIYIVLNSHTPVLYLKTLLSSLHGNQKAKRLQSHCSFHRKATRFEPRINDIDWVTCCIISSKKKNLDARSFLVVS